MTPSVPTDQPTDQPTDSGTQGPAATARFAVLPPHVPLDETVETTPSDEARDPDFDPDPDRDWLLRYS